MAKKNLRDAREWLKASNVHYIGNHDWGGDEDTNKDSIKIVDELFAKGATKVEVDIYDEADDFACKMIVTLPTDESKVRGILGCLGELYADSVEVETKKGGRVFVTWGD